MEYKPRMSVSRKNVMTALIGGERAKSPRDVTMGWVDDVVFWHRMGGSPVTSRDIFSRCRYRHVVIARADVMKRLREKGWSYPKIGSLLGMDHTTIMHHVERKPKKTSVSYMGSAQARERLLIQARQEKADWATHPIYTPFEASSNGAVRYRRGNKNPLVLHVDTSGKLYLRLNSGGRGGRSTQILLDHFVAECFLGECPAGSRVIHLDGDITNNRINNLAFVRVTQEAVSGPSVGNRRPSNEPHELHQI